MMCVFCVSLYIGKLYVPWPFISKCIFFKIGNIFLCDYFCYNFMTFKNDFYLLLLSWPNNVVYSIFTHQGRIQSRVRICLQLGLLSPLQSETFSQASFIFYNIDICQNYSLSYLMECLSFWLCLMVPQDQIQFMHSQLKQYYMEDIVSFSWYYFCRHMMSSELHLLILITQSGCCLISQLCHYQFFSSKSSLWLICFKLASHQDFPKIYLSF